MIAAGGRYDNLLKAFQYPFSGSFQVHAVGVNIGNLFDYFKNGVAKRTNALFWDSSSV